ncbi:unnamed protein product [Darwinula stevensoni]|uniref:Lipase domain-containing protein n=1 Tax=Darwinula stevensoni TaxID=69355 RepID=A0A7R9A6W4_9CRUS|nr:unnamed protein product [Darwinula stevensoni]CAG0895853.1 unnamed protein product [Darwinula stevensoni]
MPLNIPVLVVNYLLSVMSDASWQKLVDSYMKVEIASVDDVLDPDALPSGASSVGSCQFPIANWYYWLNVGWSGTDFDRFPILCAGRRDGKECHPPYGCFSTAFPWRSAQRPEALFPEPPEVIRPVFCLYTRRNPTECYRLRTNETQRLEESPFDPGHPVTLLTHGYLEHGRKPWLMRLTKELLKAKEQNVVVLSWLGGSGPPHAQGEANIRLLGVMAAHFLAFLAVRLTFFGEGKRSREAGTRMEEVHVVGHSMGAHLASYIGSTLKVFGLGKLGRITGLDPGSHHFEYADPRVRLDPEDALFVGVRRILCVVTGLGTLQPLGHLDFYPNSGARMPGCGLSLQDAFRRETGSVLNVLTRFVVCSHLKAYDYFIESVNSPCPMLALQCSNWVEFTELLLKSGQRFLVPTPDIGEIQEILVELELGGTVRNSTTRRFLSQPRIIIDRVIVQTLEHRATTCCERTRVKRVAAFQPLPEESEATTRCADGSLNAIARRADDESSRADDESSRADDESSRADDESSRADDESSRAEVVTGVRHASVTVDDDGSVSLKRVT